jgi:hypothetical protein
MLSLSKRTRLHRGLSLSKAGAWPALRRAQGSHGERLRALAQCQMRGLSLAKAGVRLGPPFDGLRALFSFQTCVLLVGFAAQNRRARRGWRASASLRRVSGAIRRGPSASRDWLSSAPSREMFHSWRRRGRWRAGSCVRHEAPVHPPGRLSPRGLLHLMRYEVRRPRGSTGFRRRAFPRSLRGKHQSFTLNHLAHRIGSNSGCRLPSSGAMGG